MCDSMLPVTRLSRVWQTAITIGDEKNTRAGVEPM